jgi:hypothetical protein
LCTLIAARRCRRCVRHPPRAADGATAPRQ